MFPNWAKNIILLLVYMISGLVLVIIIEGLLSGNELIPLNTAIEQVVMRMRTPIITNFLVLVTRMGNPSVLLSLTTLVAILLYMKRRRYDAVLFVSTMAVTVISLTILKNTFQISRPGYGIIEASGWSFPSGHASLATAFFFILIYTFIGRVKDTWRKTLLVAASIIAAILICFSRLYLGAHWTLDILAGIALGVLSVSFTLLVFNIFLENRRSLRERIRP